MKKLSLQGILANKKTVKSFAVTVSAIAALTLLYRASGLYYRKPIYLPIFAQRLNRYDIVLASGEEYKLFIYRINKRVTWSSSNFRVAFVNFNGRVYALQHGKAIITAKVGSKKYRCRVTVIDLNKDKLVMRAGDTYHLRVLGSSFFTTYKSSNKKVAKVSMFGKVKAVGKGSAVITVRVRGKRLKCIVTVK